MSDGPSKPEIPKGDSLNVNQQLANRLRKLAHEMHAIADAVENQLPTMYRKSLELKKPLPSNVSDGETSTG